MKKILVIVGVIFIMLTALSVSGYAENVKVIGGGGCFAALAKTEKEMDLFTAIYKDGKLCDIDKTRGQGEFTGRNFTLSPLEGIKAFLWDSGLHSFGKSDIVYPETGIESATLSVSGKEYTAVNDPFMDSAEFYIITEKSKGTSYEEYGAGYNVKEALKNASPYVLLNTDGETLPSVLNLTEGVSIKTPVKNVNLKAFTLSHQFSTTFKGATLHSASSMPNFPSRWGLPKWSSDCVGENVWYWTEGEMSEGVETSAENDAFHIRKTQPYAKAGFYSSTGFAKRNISRVITEYDINIKALEGSGIKIGTKGAVVFKKEGECICLYYCKDFSDTSPCKLYLAPILDIGESYRVKTIEKNTLTDEGYKIRCDIYIDDIYAGSFDSIYNTSINLEKGNTYFDSFSDTTFEMTIDSYSILFAEDDSVDIISEKVYNSLEGFKNIVSPSILSWLAGVFDKDTGAFYFANSSRNMEKSEPFIESTAFALEFLKTSGVFTASEFKNGTYPAEYVEKAVNYIKSLQGDDLYFYQNIWGKDVSTTRRNRDLSFARQVLSSFGASAVYPDTVNVSDAQLLAVDDIRDYLESEEKMKIYLDSLDWSKKGIWSTGDKLSSSKSVIASAGLLDFVREYIKNKQNTETGLWAEGCDMQNINGAMKLSSYFTKASPYPNVDKMADSVIEVLKDETKLTSSTSLWNPVELLNRAIGSYGDSLPFKTKKKITDGMEYIVDLLIKHTAKFKKSDGGYSSYSQKSSSAMMGYPASLGIEESDMDATIIIGIRLAESVYGVLDLEMPKYLSEYKDEFLSSLLAEGAAK